MSEPSAAQWLYQEAIDHLDADVLGAYELLWLLRGSPYSVSDEQARLLARSTLTRVLEDRSTQLVPLKWPGREEAGDSVALDRLTDDELFEFGEDGLYYALVLADGD